MGDLSNAKPIRLLILDVDGILTNGVIYYSNDGNHYRGFHTRDGLGLKLLKRTGVEIGIISAKKSSAVAQRMEDLNITWVYLGHEEKTAAYEELKSQLKLKDSEIAYMGDDLPDLPLLIKAGLAITVPQAPLILQQHADFITQQPGGKGAVREACELIMTAQGTFETVLQSFLS